MSNSSFSIRFHQSRNLSILLFTTFLLRFSGYMAISVFASKHYLGMEIPNVGIGILLSTSPISELCCVSFFGILADRLQNRKIVLLIGMVITAFCLFLYSLTNNLMVLFFIAILHGIGAAAQVTACLALFASHSTRNTVSFTMGLFDAATFGGFLFGYSCGALGLEYYAPEILFRIASLIKIISALFIFLFLIEKHEKKVISPPLKLFKDIIGNKNIQKLSIVWIPVMCLASIVLTFGKRVLEIEYGLTGFEFTSLFVIYLLSVIVALPFFGKASDKLRVKKPFMILGLFSFFILISTLGISSFFVGNLASYYLPLLIIIGCCCSAFPPAALGMLVEFTPEEEEYGTSMGVYAFIFGLGMIIGPFFAGIALDAYQIPGLIGLCFLFTLISVVGTINL